MASTDQFLSPNRATRASRQQLRRLSSQDASRGDLFSGPTLVAPPHHVDRPSDAHSTALAIEMAKHHLAEGDEGATPPDSGPHTPQDASGVSTTDKYAFAFDIDGVLIRGGEVIPEAIEAMKMLNGQNDYNIKV